MKLVLEREMIIRIVKENNNLFEASSVLLSQIGEEDATLFAETLRNNIDMANASLVDEEKMFQELKDAAKFSKTMNVEFDDKEVTIEFSDEFIVDACKTYNTLFVETLKLVIHNYKLLKYVVMPKVKDFFIKWS